MRRSADLCIRVTAGPKDELIHGDTLTAFRVRSRFLHHPMVDSSMWLSEVCGDKTRIAAQGSFRKRENVIPVALPQAPTTPEIGPPPSSESPRTSTAARAELRASRSTRPDPAFPVARHSASDTSAARQKRSRISGMTTDSMSRRGRGRRHWQAARIARKRAQRPSSATARQEDDHGRGSDRTPHRGVARDMIDWTHHAMGLSLVPMADGPRRCASRGLDAAFRSER